MSNANTTQVLPHGFLEKLKLAGEAAKVKFGAAHHAAGSDAVLYVPTDDKAVNKFVNIRLNGYVEGKSGKSAVRVKVNDDVISEVEVPTESKEVDGKEVAGRTHFSLETRFQVIEGSDVGFCSVILGSNVPYVEKLVNYPKLKWVSVGSNRRDIAGMQEITFEADTQAEGSQLQVVEFSVEIL